MKLRQPPRRWDDDKRELACYVTSSLMQAVDEDNIIVLETAINIASVLLFRMKRRNKKHFEKKENA